VISRGRGCVLMIMLAAAVVQAEAANLVADPGFESGIPSSYTGSMGDGWVVTAGTGAICNISGAACGNAGPSNSGSQMAFLDWSTTFNTISQTLTTVVGQSYDISYWIFGDHPNLLQVTFGGSTLFSGTAPASSTYVQYSFVSTATSTSTVLAFSGQRTVAGVELLDDVSVTAAPEPATWLLAFAALSGLAAMRRHRDQTPQQ